MLKVRFVAATVAVVLGGLATGAAFAGGPPAEHPGAKGKAAVCNRLDEMIEAKQNAGNRLEKVAAKIQARIDSGDLTDEQKARAEKHLDARERADRQARQARRSAAGSGREALHA